MPDEKEKAPAGTGANDYLERETMSSNSLWPDFQLVDCGVTWCVGHQAFPGESIADQPHIGEEEVLVEFGEPLQLWKRNCAAVCRVADAHSSVSQFDVYVEIEGQLASAELEALARELEDLAVRLRTLAGSL